MAERKLTAFLRNSVSAAQGLASQLDGRVSHTLWPMQAWFVPAQSSEYCTALAAEFQSLMDKSALTQSMLLAWYFRCDPSCMCVSQLKGSFCKWLQVRCRSLRSNARLTVVAIDLERYERWQQQQMVVFWSRVHRL